MPSEHYTKASELMAEAVRMDVFTRVYAFKGPRQIHRALVALDDAIPQCRGEERALLEAQRDDLRGRVSKSERLRVAVREWSGANPEPKFEPDGDIGCRLDFEGWAEQMARPQVRAVSREIDEQIATSVAKHTRPAG